MSAIVRDIDRPENSHKIDYIRIVTTKNTVYDITQLLIELNIYESLRNDSIEGSLLFMDENSIMTTIPIIGREKLEVSFSSRDDSGKFLPSYIKTFSIIKPDQVVRDKTVQVETAMIRFVSPEYIRNKQVKLSRSMSGTPSEMFTSIMTQLFPSVQLIVEDTLYPKTIVIPNRHPFDFIHWLSNNAVSKKNLSADFAFFENIDGYHFRSVYTMMNPAVPIKTLNNDHLHVQDTYDRYNIHEFNVVKQFDMSDQLEGILGSTSSAHNVEDKSMVSHTMDYYTYVKKFPSMNGGSLFVDDTMEQHKNSYEIFDVAEGIFSDNSSWEDNGRLLRDINRGLLDSYMATAYMPGNVDVKLGDVVNIHFVASEKMDQQDYFRSGKHIITHLRHTVTISTYFQTLELAKDSNVIMPKELT